MKTIRVTQPNNLSLLHDEILAAIPECRPHFDENGEQVPTIRVEGVGDDIRIEVPDTVNIDQVAAVIQAHDPTKSQPDSRRDRLARIAEINSIPRSEWTAAQMRELISLIAQELTA